LKLWPSVEKWLNLDRQPQCTCKSGGFTPDQFSVDASSIRLSTVFADAIEAFDQSVNEY
jgi:hypothetical protein